MPDKENNLSQPGCLHEEAHMNRSAGAQVLQSSRYVLLLCVLIQRASLPCRSLLGMILLKNLSTYILPVHCDYMFTVLLTRMDLWPAYLLT